MSTLSAPTAPKVETPFLAEAAFQTVAQRNKHLPAWWRELQAAAWARSQSLPLPARTDELWRFSDLQSLRLAEPFQLAAQLDAGAANDFVARSQSVKKRAAKIVFVNDLLVQHEPISPELKAKGVIFEPLETALLKHGDLIRKFIFAQKNQFMSDKLASLHAALTTAGIVLFVPKGVEVSEPFCVHHWVSGERAAVFPHTLVITEENAKATLVDFRSGAQSDAETFSAGVKELHVGAGSQLQYIAAQNLGTRSLVFQSGETVVQRDARALSLSLQLGGRTVRHESHSRLQGSGAHSEMLSLSVARQGQMFDQRTLQTHEAPNTSSNLLFKNALFENGRTVFSGLIVVEPEAQKTDAYQSNRNLLCSADAEANSLPGLEIEANDVRCTHGSTTGKVDDEHLFYFGARGIDPVTARRLLVFGFFEEVLGKIEDEALHDLLREQIEQKFRDRA